MTTANVKGFPVSPFPTHSLFFCHFGGSSTVPEDTRLLPLGSTTRRRSGTLIDPGWPEFAKNCCLLSRPFSRRSPHPVVCSVCLPVAPGKARHHPSQGTVLLCAPSLVPRNEARTPPYNTGCLVAAVAAALLLAITMEHGMGAHMEWPAPAALLGEPEGMDGGAATGFEGEGPPGRCESGLWVKKVERVQHSCTLVGQ